MSPSEHDEFQSLFQVLRAQTLQVASTFVHQLQERLELAEHDRSQGPDVQNVAGGTLVQFLNLITGIFHRTEEGE